MSVEALKQSPSESDERVRQYEAGLQSVKAQLQETIERYETSTEEPRAVKDKLAEEELRESEERLKLTAEAGRIGNWQIDLTRGTLESSVICKANFGLAANEDLSFERFFEILHADDRDRVRAALEKAVETRTDYDAEYRVLWSDNSVHWIFARGRAFYAADGTPLRMLGVTQNITERKAAEERLRKSEERFRSYFELGLIGIAITSPTKGVLEVNDEICKILGYERSELLQMNWVEITHPDDVAADVANFNRVTAGEIDGYSMDKRWIRKDGQVIYSTISVKALRRADGSVDYFVALLEDVTERKRAEQALRVSEEKYRTLFTTVDEGFLLGEAIRREDGTLDFLYGEVNPAYEKITGITKESLIGRTAREAIPDLEEEWYEIVGRVGFGGESIRVERGAAPIGKWLNAYLSPVGEKGSGKLVVIFHDITESKRFETLLGAQKRALEMVVGGSPLAEVLAYLASIVERQSANSSIASLMLLDDQGRLHNGAAASLPADFIQALDGIEADESVGTCSRAAATGKVVITPDIAADPRWLDFKHLPLSLGLQSAWSMPIVAPDRRVLGTFGTYFREKREPTGFERQTVEILCGTAALAIQRKRVEEALQRAHDELERRVAERTQELTVTLAALREEEERRKEVLRRLFSAQEDERRRIARDMHDQFGQELTTLSLHLSALKEGCGQQTAMRGQVEALEADVRRLDRDINLLVWELRPTALDDLGLEAALNNFIRNWSQHSGVPVELYTSRMELDRLTPEIETALYRITQEALNNIAKYAHAAHVDVILERRADHVSLIIEDNGIGFDVGPPPSADKAGFGLIGMRERAALIGGTVLIESRPGAGATVFVRIPAPHVENE